MERLLKSLCPFIHPSVGMNETAWELLKGFLLNFTFVGFTKFCQHIPILVSQTAVMDTTWRLAYISLHFVYTWLSIITAENILNKGCKEKHIFYPIVSLITLKSSQGKFNGMNASELLHYLHISELLNSI